MDVIYSLAGLICISIILWLFSLNQKNDVWQGTLIEKYVNGKTNSQKQFNFKFRTNKNHIHVITVNESLYNEINIGDKFEKVKGSTIPKKTI